MSGGRTVAIELNLGEVSQYHGLRCRGLVRPRSVVVIEKLLAEIAAQDVLRGRLSFAVCPIDNIEHGVIHLADGGQLQAPIAAHKLNKASHLFMGVVTLGEVIGEAVSRRFENKRRLEAIMLDEIANFCLMKAVNDLEQCGAQEAQRRGLTISGPLSPGEDGFELSAQGTILKRADAEAVGVSITSASMMYPRHSLTVVYGIGQSMPVWSQLKNCEDCRSRDKCPHRLALEA